MFLLVLGFLTILWAVWARGGGNPANSAEIFRGDIGGAINGLVIVVGLVLILPGIF